MSYNDLNTRASVFARMSFKKPIRHSFLLELFFRLNIRTYFENIIHWHERLT